MFGFIKSLFKPKVDVDAARYYKMAKEKFNRSYPSMKNDNAYYDRKSDKDYYDNYIPETKEEFLERFAKSLEQKRGG